MTAPNVTISNAGPHDDGFIIDAMKSSFSNFMMASLDTCSSSNVATDEGAFFNVLSRSIYSCIKNASVKLVARDPDDPTLLHGFIVADPPVVHYVFTKFASRKHGIAKALLSAINLGPNEPIRCTHWGFLMGQLAPKYGLIYTPNTKGRKHGI